MIGCEGLNDSQNEGPAFFSRQVQQMKQIRTERSREAQHIHGWVLRGRLDAVPARLPLMATIQNVRLMHIHVTQ